MPSSRNRSSGPPPKPRALLIVMIVFAVIVVAGVIFYTVGTQTDSPAGAAQPAPERLESSPTSPQGGALPPNAPGE